MEVFEKIASAVIKGDQKETLDLVGLALGDNLDPTEVLNNGLRAGIDTPGPQAGRIRGSESARRLRALRRPADRSPVPSLMAVKAFAGTFAGTSSRLNCCAFLRALNRCGHFRSALTAC